MTNSAPRTPHDAVSTEETATKFCVDCRHWIGARASLAPECGHPDVRETSLVTGRAVAPLCILARVSGACGESAVLFEKREVERVRIHVEPLPAPLAPVKRDEKPSTSIVRVLYRTAFVCLVLYGVASIVRDVWRACGGGA